MWTKEEIELINPTSGGQNRSALDYLYKTGAANPELLCEAANILEKLDHPHVMTFCLLPVVLNADEDSFIMDSWGVNVPPIELRFKSVILSMNSTGTIDQYGARSVDNPHDKMVITPATLAIGMIPIWGKRKSLYAEYRLCVSENGLNDRIIGERQPWMQLPCEANNGPLSAKAFENELTVRVRREMVFVLCNFLRTYEIAQMSPLLNNLYLYSYFAMTYPGRLSTGGLPLPVYHSLKEFISRASPKLLDRERFKYCYKSIIAKEDRIVCQLLSMAKLIEQGEPELAIVGAVSSLEWFLNATFPKFIRTDKDGRNFQLPLIKCVRKKVVSDLLPSSLIDKINDIVKIRNTIAHGQPSSNSNSNELADFARDALESCLDLYRLVNLNLNCVKNITPDQIQKNQENLIFDR